MAEKEDGAKKDAGNDDLAIDFSKIKSFFSRLFSSEKNQPSSRGSPQRESTSKESTDDELTIDTAALKNFFLNPKVHLVLWLLIPLLLTFYLRVVPSSLPATDYFAQASVYKTVQEQIAGQINQKFPNLPDTNKQALADQEFKKILEAEKPLLDQQVAATAAYFKSAFTYPAGTAEYPYLGDIDSYYWLRYARNLVDKGTYCDKEIDGKCIDTYTMAPVDLDASVTMHPYAIVAVYYLFHAFNSNLTLMQASFYTPLIFALISTLSAFFIARKITNNFGGFIAGVLIAASPMYLTRSLGSDTDVYTVFFPLLILWFFVEAFEEEHWKHQVIYASLAGFTMFIFAYTWIGWWFFVDLIGGTLVAYGLYLLVRAYYHHKTLRTVFHDPLFKRCWVILVAYLVVSGVLISVFIHWSSFLSLIAPFTFKPKEAANPDMWPNVLTTVAEFNSASLEDIIRTITGSTGIGGKVVYILAIFGIAFSFINRQHISSRDVLYLMATLAIALVLLSPWALGQSPLVYLALLSLPLLGGALLRLLDKHEVNIREGILITLWIIGSMYASTAGVRFILLLVPPFALSVAFTLGVVFDIATDWFNRAFKVKGIIVNSVIGILLLLAILSPVKAGYSASHVFIPSVNDAWHDALTKIQKESASDAIINSWWDFGHWFKFYADRRVTLDGSSQNAPPLHWLGKALLTPDERQAVAILRMLDCGSNNAYEALHKKINFTPATIQLLNEVILLPKEQAQQYLINRSFTQDEASVIVEYTHCTPPENYFITSADMIGKAPVWAHFGSWNFTKAFAYYQLRGADAASALDLLQKKMGMSKEAANALYLEAQNVAEDAANNWIAPWPNYLSGMSRCEQVNGTVYCGNGFVLNMSSGDGHLVTPEGNQRVATVMYTTDNDTIRVQTYANATVKNRDHDVGVVVVPDGKALVSLFMDQELTPSMFTRLYYMNGYGLECFDLFDTQREITGGDIYVWKVDWNCTTPNLPQSPLQSSALQHNETVS